jgi:hypothetical protein
VTSGYSGRCSISSRGKLEAEKDDLGRLLLMLTLKGMCPGVE